MERGGFRAILGAQGPGQFRGAVDASWRQSSMLDVGNHDEGGAIKKFRGNTLALAGKVYCKVDARFGAVEVGDLLTTAPTPGHAMKADDPVRAFGAVIGKALRPLEAGTGLIPIIVALQ